MTGGGLPIDDGSMPYCTFAAGTNQGNSAGQGEITGDSCVPIGLVSQQSWVIDTYQSPQVIQVTFSGGKEGQQTVASVTCDPSADDPTFTVKGETRTLVYEVDITSKFACAPPTPPTPPTPPPPTPPTPPTPPPVDKKYNCINNKCEINYNNTGGTLEQCGKICKNIYWGCIEGYCIPNLSSGLNRSMCQHLCK
uniref:Uncharacterized protein n=1 Tax=viral metagenome TaxID=1070528 RepID=A0A6C0ELB8_9ZZZZ